MTDEPVGRAPSPLLVDPARARDNNFTLMRLVLALAVLFSHCFPLSQGTERADWGYIATRGQLNLGDIAVDAFFMISGFLIMQSWDQSSWPMAYLRKRILRIHPGYFVATAFSVLVVGSLGAADWSQYWTAFREHAWSSVGAALALEPPHAPPTLLTVPYPNATNGSMWTIRPEFECYLLVILIGSLHIRVRTIVTTTLLAILIVVRMALPTVNNQLTSGSVVGDAPWLWIRFGLCFLSGTVLYCHRTQVPRRSSWFWLALVGLAITSVTGVGLEIWLPLGGAYALFYVAFHRKVIRTWFVANGRDWSYGIYLYAWPIQQLIALRFRAHLMPYSMFALALVPTLAAAAASWVLIERPALRFK